MFNILLDFVFVIIIIFNVNIFVMVGLVFFIILGWVMGDG